MEKNVCLLPCLLVCLYFTYYLHELKGMFIGETVAIFHRRHCTACSDWTYVEQEDGLDGLCWSLPNLHNIL